MVTDIHSKLGSRQALVPVGVFVQVKDRYGEPERGGVNGSR
jgi:hypothetical protein